MPSENDSANYLIVTTKRTKPKTIAVTTAEVKDKKGPIATTIVSNRYKKQEPLWAIKEGAQVRTRVPASKQNIKRRGIVGTFQEKYPQSQSDDGEVGTVEPEHYTGRYAERRSVNWKYLKQRERAIQGTIREGMSIVESRRESSTVCDSQPQRFCNHSCKPPAHNACKIPDRLERRSKLCEGILPTSDMEGPH